MIRISRANWERLKHFAIPLEDSIDDALSKVLTLAESSEENLNSANTNKNILKETKTPNYSAQETITNEKPLLLEFENWLQLENTSDITMISRKKTMATWELKTKSGKTFKLFVPTDGGNALCLPKGNYSSIDKLGKVIQKDSVSERTGKPVGWYHYALFSIKTQDDVTLAKNLVNLIINIF